MDSSKTKIGTDGCTLTAWTMLINYELKKQGITKAGKPFEYTPAEINKILNKFSYTDPKDGKKYDGWGVERDKNDGKPLGSNITQDSGSLRLAIEKDTREKSDNKQGLVMKVHHSGNTYADNETPNPIDIDGNYAPFLEALNSGSPILVRVNGQNEAGETVADGHTVLVVGIDDNKEWLINDPFMAENEITKLSHPDYKNRIFPFMWSTFQVDGTPDPYKVPAPLTLNPSDLYDPVLNPNKYGPSSSLLNFGKFSAVPEPVTIAILIPAMIAVAREARRNRRSRRRASGGKTALPHGSTLQ
jgi:hypothetical protein